MKFENCRLFRATLESGSLSLVMGVAHSGAHLGEPLASDIAVPTKINDTSGEFASMHWINSEESPIIRESGEASCCSP